MGEMARDNAHDAMGAPVWATRAVSTAPRPWGMARDKAHDATGSPVWATRAVGAAVYSLGQRPRYTTTKLLSRYRRKSSRRRYRSKPTHGRGYTC